MFQLPQNQSRIISYMLKTRPVYYRYMTTEILKKDALCTAFPSKLDIEWNQAKPYENIPGPKKWPFVMSFFPGGSRHKMDSTDLQMELQKKYGDIYRIPGILGNEDTIFVYNANDFEKIMRTEGQYPQRLNLKTLRYYQKELRKDLYKGRAGLVNEDGQMWSTMRSKVNPILMKPQILGHHLPVLDQVAKEFVERIANIRNPRTLEVPENFDVDLRKWGLEGVGIIALDTRLNLFNSEKIDPNVMKLFNAIKTVLQLTFELDMAPPILKYIKRNDYKKLLQSCDDLTNCIIPYINQALHRLEKTGSSKSALEQLLKEDKSIAILMAIDFIGAGVETTASTVMSLVYLLATNQDKQEKVREEIFKILPEKDSPLTEENTKNMPYLRASIKETLRIKPPLTIYSRRTGKDLTLSGYKIPKGILAAMVTGITCNNDKYFKESNKFLPERWIKQGSNAYPQGRTTNHFAYMPFGFGPRICVGKRIAEMEIETLICRILRNYKVSWNYDDLEYKSNLVNFPIGELKFKFEDI